MCQKRAKSHKIKYASYLHTTLGESNKKTTSTRTRYRILLLFPFYFWGQLFVLYFGFYRFHVSCNTLTLVYFQAHVPHCACLVLGPLAADTTTGSLCCAAGHSSIGFASLSLCISSQLVAGGRQGGSPASGTHLCASRQSHQPGGTAQAGRILREGEADQQ